MPHGPNRDVVERRAYELYERRGRGDGNDRDDWLEAERQLRDQAVENDVTGVEHKVGGALASKRRARRGQVVSRGELSQ